MLTGIQKIDGKSYAFTADGQEIFGQATISGKRYLFDKTTGEMQYGRQYLADQKVWVLYNRSSGEMLFGQQLDQGHWYLFDANTGAMQYGRQYISAQKKWVLYDRVSGVMKYGQQSDQGHWYLFDSATGAMKYGRQYISAQKKWVLYDRVAGVMKYGQQKDQGHWYLFNKTTGAMQYGSQNLSAYGQKKTVFYDTISGVMRYGWLQVGTQQKHFNTTTGAQDRTFAPVYYSQLDPRWSGVTIGVTSFGMEGCAMTDVAMISTGYGINISPLTAGYRGYSVSGFGHYLNGSSETDIITTARSFGLKTGLLTSQAQIEAKLRQGYPVVIAVQYPFISTTGATHEIVLFGYGNGKTSVSDPWGNQHSGLTSLSYIWNSRSRWAMDNNAGGSPALVIYQ